MSEGSIERILREEFPPRLPLGFAERIAAAVMAEGRSTTWDFLLRLSPRVSLVLGGAAAVLLLLNFTGDAPGLFEAVSQYSSAESFIPLP